MHNPSYHVGWVWPFPFWFSAFPFPCKTLLESASRYMLLLILLNLQIFPTLVIFLKGLSWYRHQVPYECLSIQHNYWNLGKKFLVKRCASEDIKSLRRLYMRQKNKNTVSKNSKYFSMSRSKKFSLCRFGYYYHLTTRFRFSYRYILFIATT